MMNRAITVMKAGTVVSNERGRVYDLEAYKKIHAQVYVKVAANSSQTLQLEHSAVDDEDAFTNLGSTIDIASTGNKVSSIDAFLRFVRIKASGSITTLPTLSIYLVAKEN